MEDTVVDKPGDKPSTSALSHTQVRILSELRNNPNITIPKLAKILSLAIPTIEKAMSGLKKKGMVERKGSAKSGYWLVIE